MKKTKHRTPSDRLALFMRDARIKAGLSQGELAEALGYKSAQFVSNWERGVSSPPLALLRKLATVLGVDIVKIKTKMRAKIRHKITEKFASV